LVVSHGNPICVSVGDEVVISGMRVRPGDLLHGDANGVVLIPDECAAEVADASYRIWAREDTTMRQISQSDFSMKERPEPEH
jgi:4-hydroxy-4-methyl-2-oxoglutarate aldolase